MEEFPGKDFLGGLFTFDNRVVMNFTKDREVIGVCDMCNEKTERFDNCINDECHVHMMVCQECRDNNKFIWCSDKCRETGRMGKVRFRDMADLENEAASPKFSNPKEAIAWLNAQ